MKRRDFLKLMGSSTMAFVVTSCSDREGASFFGTAGQEMDFVDFEILCESIQPWRNFSELILFRDTERVEVYTGRSEMGQGLTTVLVSIVSEAFEIEPDHVDVFLADTDLCPDDGPTSGSSATSYVGWPIWCACLEIKDDIIAEGAKRLGVDPSEVRFSRGTVSVETEPESNVSMFQMKRDGIRFTNPDTTPQKVQMYRDPGLRNVRALDVVTGKLKYAGDMMVGKTQYGGFFTPAEFPTAYRFKPVDLQATLAVPGVITAGNMGRHGPYVVAENFVSLQKGLAAIDRKSMVPKKKTLVNNLSQVRESARLTKTVEDTGDVERHLKNCRHTLSETYTTHLYNVAFLEPQSSVAIVSDDEAHVWDSTQHAHLQQQVVARDTKIPVERVHVTGTNVGGGFGGKIAHKSGAEAAMIAQATGLPIKCVYSRAQVFQRFSRAKEEVAVDLISGVNDSGKIIARSADIYQDEGHGMTDIYDIPNSKIRLFRVSQDQMGIRHATIRGTSYTQDVFAMESHMSSLAHSISMDPLDFRLKNVLWHKDLLHSAAEMIDYGVYRPPEDHGLGMAIINHGDRQFGALFVEVGVDRMTGMITIHRMRAAFDIGVVICETTATIGIIGALIWGLSITMKEELKVDENQILTNSFADYDIARFSDLPDMKIKYLKAYGNGLSPRGCGEMPLPLVAPAVANAVYNAVGVRLFATPFTPERVLAAIRGQQA